MDMVLIAIGLLIIISSAYMLGHWFGYGKGEEDTLERVKFIQWNESRGVSREEYFKDK